MTQLQKTTSLGTLKRPNPFSLQIFYPPVPFVVMCVGDLSIVNVPDNIELDTPTTLTWSADTLGAVNIYSDDVLLAEDIDASLGTYDITLDSSVFDVSDTPVIGFKSVSGVMLDSEQITII